MDKNIPEHPVYKACSEAEADAHAWVFADKDTFTQFHYKLPALEEQEVRGRVLYVGMCHSDSMHGRSKWFPILYPVATGHEVVAEVLEVGSKVSDIAKGDIFLVGCLRKVCHTCQLCQKGSENLCTLNGMLKYTYGKFFGGYGTHIQLDHDLCFKAPKGLKLENAAPLMCAGITTYAPIKRWAKKGDKVAVLGVGGLGHVAVQWANKMGMEVTALVSNLQSEAKVKALGAHNVVDWVNGDLSKYKDCFNVMLCTLPIAPNKEQMYKLFETIAHFGHFVEVGAPASSENLTVSPFALILKELSIHGSAIGSIAETKEMLQFAADTGVEVICEHFAYQDFPKALNKMENGKPYFRCVVDVDPVSKKFHK